MTKNERYALLPFPVILNSDLFNLSPSFSTVPVRYLVLVQEVSNAGITVIDKHAVQPLAIKFLLSIL